MVFLGCYRGVSGVLARWYRGGTVDVEGGLQGCYMVVTC